jgi:hypothetical protein
MVFLLVSSFPPFVHCAIPQQQEPNNDKLVAVVAATPEEMVKGDVDGEVVEIDIALSSVPAGAVERPALRSSALTLNLSAALKKAVSSMKAQKSKNISNKLNEHKLITGLIVQFINGYRHG